MNFRRSQSQRALSFDFASLIWPNFAKPLRWTLFGPYDGGQPGPRGNGPAREINDLWGCGTSQNAQNQLEVLAGATSWGFKSPSPHHILNDLSVFVRTLIKLVNLVLDLMDAPDRSGPASVLEAIA
jgi:hypothetical protein